MNKYLLAACLSLFVLGIAFLYQRNKFHDTNLHITFCDVGQGDGILIRTPNGKDILVDGGPDESILSCLSENMPFWDRKIELMILTHPHADHYYGLLQLARRYDVDTFITQPQQTTGEDKILLNTLKQKQTTIHSTCQGDTITSGIVKIQTLWPTNCDKQAVGENSDLNDLSVVQLLSFGNFQLLLTGDINELIAAQIDDVVGDVEVLKVPHHGSRIGFDKTFLDTVSPELAIISVGEKNRYGHPSLSILQLLKEAKIKTLRTDQQGTVKLISDGKRFWVPNKR